jgi:hypothetical protein
MKIFLSILEWVSFAFVLVTSTMGIQNGFDNISSSQTAGQWACTILQFIYGAAGTIAAIGFPTKQKWAYGLSWIWAISFTVAGGIAPMAWADTSILASLFGGALCAVITGLIVYLWRRRFAVGAKKA